jgi:hypothetical protein
LSDQPYRRVIICGGPSPPLLLLLPGECGLPTVREYDADQLLERYGGPPRLPAAAAWWAAYGRGRGLRLVVAEGTSGGLEGLAVADARADAVYVLHLEGAPEAARLLLEYLVGLAGDREVSGWLPDDPALHGVLQAAGFASGEWQAFWGRAYRLYRRVPPVSVR